MDGIRGLHVDIARHFRTKEELLKIIDSMAMHKLNTMHLHLSDFQGWRVEIKAYPKLTTIGAIGNKTDPKAPAKFLTQEEVKEIVAYAASRYITIIPEVDMPGHMGAAIRAYPELKHPKDERDPAKVISACQRRRQADAFPVQGAVSLRRDRYPPPMRIALGDDDRRDHPP